MIQYHFMQELISDVKVKLEHCLMEDNCVGIFTNSDENTSWKYPIWKMQELGQLNNAGMRSQMMWKFGQQAMQERASRQCGT